MYNQAGLCLKHRYGYYIYKIYYMLHFMFIYIFLKIIHPLLIHKYV